MFPHANEVPVDPSPLETFYSTTFDKALANYSRNNLESFGEQSENNGCH